MSAIHKVLQTTLLGQVMAKPPIVVRENEDFHVVRDKLETYSIRHLPVVNEAGVLVGLVTERYLYKIHSPRKLEDGSWYYDKAMLDTFILKNVMIKEPFMLKAQNSLKDAMEYMTQSKFGCVIIVDDYCMPCGIVTRNDILKFLLTQ